MRHLPNTWINGGEKHETEWLKAAVSESIDALDMTEAQKEKARLTPGCAGLVRAIAKASGPRNIPGMSLVFPVFPARRARAHEHHTHTHCTVTPPTGVPETRPRATAPGAAAALLPPG